MQIVNGDCYIGHFIAPTVIAQQADAFSGIKDYPVTNSNIRSRIIPCNNGRALQMQAIPIGRKRTLQIGRIGQAVGADQPWTGIIRQAMYGRASADIIKNNTASGSIRYGWIRMVSSAKQQAWQSNVNIQRCTSCPNAADQQQAKIKQNDIPRINPNMINRSPRELLDPTELETVLFKWGFISFCLRLMVLNMSVVYRIFDYFLLLSVFPFYYYLRYLVRNNRSFVFVAIVFLLSVFYILKVTVFASAEYQYESVYFSWSIRCLYILYHLWIWKFYSLVCIKRTWALQCVLVYSLICW